MGSLLLLPLPFYLCLIAVAVLFRKAWEGRHEGWGIPMAAVLATASAWYLGDALYNDYDTYILTLGTAPLTDAWWEVLLFFVAFGVLVPVMNLKMNGSLSGGSRVLVMIRHFSIDTENFQGQLSLIAGLLVIPWIALMTFGLIHSRYNVFGMFFPYLGLAPETALGPWDRDRLAAGSLDAVLALAGYLHVMFTALFGMILVLSRRGSTIFLSGFVYFLSSPFFFFGRTRNTMLAVFLPGFLAFVALRMKSSFFVRMVVVALAFLAVEGWMKFVIDNRDQASIATAFKEGGVQDEEIKSRKHLGFNMLEELGYINYFVANGSYKVNWGGRYFAEIVNPIPRRLWPGKPLIGIDYAIARGMAWDEAGEKSGGIAASISTGMIGQGVVNFGRILGPMAAALLMALWVAALARQDLLSDNIFHLLLFAFGLVLTFNMGRDITLLTIYPFLFGWLLLHLFFRKHFHRGLPVHEA